MNFKLAMTQLLLIVLWAQLFSAENRLRLNDKGYFEARGFNVLVFENEYTGMFFDEKTAGVMFIHHGARTATGGAVRLNPTPEQWDPIPAVVERKVDKASNTIDVLLRYKDYDFDALLRVHAAGESFTLRVILDKPVPKRLQGRAGLNIEFLPSAYFRKTYLMDGRSGIFPLYPTGPMQARPMEERLPQFAGHSTFDDRGRGEFVEPKPIAQGKTLILAPEDPERRIKIEAREGELMLLDGRNVAQNGWFVVRTLLPAQKTGTAAEWTITPNTLPDWIRPPVIGHSQVGYVPSQPKVAVIELDKNDKPLATASLLKLGDKGRWVEIYKGKAVPWGTYLRYQYLRFDFSDVREQGLYALQYGRTQSGPFPIAPHVYDDTWQKTLDVWFPVQMDHMFVNEAYRVWHGAAHLDDARQAPVNHQHFDGYRLGESTESPYQPGEHIPGLNIGGWFDAGDFDIRTGSHCATVISMAEAWEQFAIDRDETLVDQAQRYVDIHHPDGKPDLLQQLEHGTLALIAQHRAFGRAIPGIIEPHLHQYHHLGDAVNITDNLIFNPNLKPYESDGFSSGTPDDRWAFTNKSPWQNYSSIAALAAASRALRGYNDELAEECLASARKAWNDEQNAPAPEGPGGRFATGRLEAALQLYICTREKSYAEEFEKGLWPAMERGHAFLMRTAVKALPYFDGAFREKLRPYVLRFKQENDEMLKQNPYGVTISTGGWAGNAGIIRWAVTNYLLHKAYPEIIGPEGVYRGLDYIYGCHPASNVSFVAGVGVRSKEQVYGNNRADFSFIAGGVVPGILVLKPDFPEHMLDWPFMWGENECVIDICADYIFLARAAQELGRGGK